MSNRPVLRPRSYILAALGFVLVGVAVGLALSGSLDLNPTPYAQNSKATATTAAALPVTSGLESPFVSVVDEALPAVVHVSSQRTSSGRSRSNVDEPFGELFRRMFPDRPAPRGPRNRPSSGSGFIFDGDGLVLTNNHVVDDADRITVTLLNNHEYDAKIIGQDPATDVAVIRIKPREDLPVLRLGDSDRIRIGDWAIAIGNPLGELSGTVTAGIISAKGRSDLTIMGGGPDYQDFIQTDASINFGNSGGPLMNIRGEVIGINTAINPSGQGIGFAIPINMAKSVALQLVAHGKVVRGYMGVLPGEITPDLAESFGIEENMGVLINQVVPDSPADRAGFERGDIVAAFDGKTVTDVTDFRLKVAETPVDKRVQVDVIRDGKHKVLYVTLADREVALASQQGQPLRGSDEEPEPATELGMSVRDMSREDREDYGSTNGVIVYDVVPGSAADDAGIAPGNLILEVNDDEIDSARHFAGAMGSARGSKRPVRLLVGRVTNSGDLFPQYIALRFPDKE
jgi:Do/DeqQ family serine protease